MVAILGKTKKPRSPSTVTGPHKTDAGSAGIVGLFIPVLWEQRQFALELTHPAAAVRVVLYPEGAATKVPSRRCGSSHVLVGEPVPAPSLTGTDQLWNRVPQLGIATLGVEHIRPRKFAAGYRAMEGVVGVEGQQPIGIWFGRLERHVPRRAEAPPCVVDDGAGISDPQTRRERSISGKLGLSQARRITSRVWASTPGFL
jgi:hypothetical protein